MLTKIWFVCLVIHVAVASQQVGRTWRVLQKVVRWALVGCYVRLGWPRSFDGCKIWHFWILLGYHVHRLAKPVLRAEVVSCEPGTIPSSVVWPFGMSWLSVGKSACPGTWIETVSWRTQKNGFTRPTPAWNDRVAARRGVQMAPSVKILYTSKAMSQSIVLLIFQFPFIYWHLFICIIPICILIHANSH